MDNKTLIAPCGMNCAICARYLALKYATNINGIKIPPCVGCRQKINKCNFQKKCSLLLKNKIKYCFECPDFPCETLKRLDKRYRTHYKMSEIDNLKYIQANSMNKFLKKEAEKWQCKKCGGLICCHNGLCFNCDTDKLKNKKKLYRWEEVN